MDYLVFAAGRLSLRRYSLEAYAADGIILLLFLWKLTAVKDEKGERQT